MADLYTIHGSLNKNHDLSLYFNDESKDIMPEIMDKSSKIDHENANTRTTIEYWGLIIKLIAVVSCFLSIIGAFISREGFESGRCSIGWVSFFENLFAVDIIIFISVLFGLDSIVSDYLERKLCKDEYDLEDYIGIKRAVESCFKNRSNEFCVVNKKRHLLVYYRAQGKHGCQIVINIGRGFTINNDLKDDIVLVDGHMDFSSKCYKMSIQMNEYTKNCLENMKEE